MKISFLGQGLGGKNENNVGYYLTTFASSNEYHSMYLISAFASKTGVAYIKEAVNKNIKIIVGIDQQVTSVEALNMILNMNVDSYVFYNPSEKQIFHPKIYLFEGKNTSKVIIGSSNLTKGGLFQNVESSILVETSLNDKDGQIFIQEIKDYFSTLLDGTDSNIKKISKELIEGLLERKIIGTEDDRILDKMIKYESQRKQAIQNSSPKLANLFPTRKVIDLPSAKDVTNWQNSYLKALNKARIKIQKLKSLGEEDIEEEEGILKLDEFIQDREQRWFFMFEQMSKYKSLNGHTNIKVRELFETGFGKVKLGAWAYVQYNNKIDKTILDERKKLLDSIGFDWGEREERRDKSFDVRFEEKFSLLKKMHDHYQKIGKKEAIRIDLHRNKDFSEVGLTHEEQKTLRNWVHYLYYPKKTEKALIEQLTDEHLRKLQSIGFQLESKVEKQKGGNKETLYVLKTLRKAKNSNPKFNKADIEVLRQNNEMLKKALYQIIFMYRQQQKGANSNLSDDEVLELIDLGVELDKPVNNTDNQIANRLKLFIEYREKKGTFNVRAAHDIIMYNWLNRRINKQTPFKKHIEHLPKEYIDEMRELGLNVDE
jgi:HKD family nuclease